jgi:large repetitive protein
MKSSLKITTALLPVFLFFSIMVSVGCDEDRAWKTADSSTGQTILTLVIADMTRTFTIGGTVSGFANVGALTLQNNGADDLVITGDGNFQFPAPLHRNDTYNATTTTPGCVVTNGSGTVVNSNITNIIVNCPAP